MTHHAGITRIVLRVVGQKRAPKLKWPASWPLPDIGHTVAIDGRVMSVRGVIFYPEGQDGHGPFVCLVMADMP